MSLIITAKLIFTIISLIIALGAFALTHCLNLLKKQLPSIADALSRGDDQMFELAQQLKGQDNIQSKLINPAVLAKTFGIVLAIVQPQGRMWNLVRILFR